MGDNLEFFRISPKEMALAFFDELEGGIISIIDVVAKFGKNPDLSLGLSGEFLTVSNLIDLSVMVCFCRR